MSAHDALDDDHSGLLSNATLSALQLQHQPFSSQLSDTDASVDNDADAAAQLFSDAVTEEQLADIKQALITGDDLLLILGENGAGKTTLTQQLSANSGLRIQCFSVTGSERFSTLNLFSGMLEAFQRTPPQKLKDILDELIPCLQSMVGRNTLSAIVLDDAHKVNQTELTQLLSGMLYMNSQDETLMRVALAATSDFEDLIPDLLPEGADLPYSSLTIEGFSPARASAYLDFRLTQAGFDQEFPFTERDMASLVDHSGGRPAQLHALTADVLNEKYGHLENSMPHELISDNDQGFLSSRKAKLGLGAAATVLILVGLLMFLPEGERQPREGAGESTDVATQEVNIQTPQMKLIDDNGESGSDAPPGTDAIANNSENAIDTAASTNPESTNAEDDITATSPAASAPEPASSNSDETQTPTDNATTNVADSNVAESPDNNERVTPAESAQTGTNDSAAGDDNESTTALAENAPDNSTNASSDLQTASNDTTTDNGNSQSEPASNDVPATPNPPATQTAEASETSAITGDDTTTQTPDNTPATVTDATAEVADQLQSPSWILVQDETQFTIQMSASRDLPSVQNFLRRNPLPGPNSIFSFEREGDVWYALVHGIFPTFSDAQRAVESMPASAQRDQPWIRSVSRVKEILREE